MRILFATGPAGHHSLSGSVDLTQRQIAIINHALSMLYSNVDEWNDDNCDDITEDEIDALRDIVSRSEGTT